ncbi:BCAM0308 family protein [Pseudomonas sp. G166]|uniref:BCAM0308 family protein n=1 Tax=Pseudomonas sp. G166 TaxID=3094846 RepID=UPI003009F98F
MDKYQESQKNKLFKTSPHDPYCLQRIEGSAVCAQCGAVYQAGNWTWSRPENTVVHDAQEMTCPACRRIHDNMPAGTLTLSGSFLQKHRSEIIHLMEHTEEKEKADHALERIIKLSDLADELIVTTTGIHLASRLGHALESAFKGKSDYRYSENEYGVSIHWARDE